ncbi:hypothetical protein IQ07DRAFT_22389 [Pyrenochaeta sp. DS3sAY3a]|nr:hypothetical protein IQ07DRAFT_22389 [Pyrenochaeta sp. DS3sAY3a]
MSQLLEVTMSPQPPNVTLMSDTDIIRSCHSSRYPRLSDPICSNKVIQISPDIVVKFGRFVKRGKFLNQRVAFQRLDSSIVRVPKPHRFFQHEAIGYLVMEFAQGDVPSVQEALAIAPQLGRILSHLHEMHGEVPGSLGGDPVQGVMWPDSDLVFKDQESLEKWLNIRLRRPGHSISFEDQGLVMCHLDFVPRNMVVYDSTVTLLDWSSAGYFPRIFDYIACSFSPFDVGFFHYLQPHLQRLTEKEEKTSRNVLRALENSQIYYFKY